MEFKKPFKMSGIDGQAKVVFTLVEPAISTFQIEASRQGVKLRGELELTQFVDLQPFAKAVTDAWREHLKLVPKISKTLSGH